MTIRKPSHTMDIGPPSFDELQQQGRTCSFGVPGGGVLWHCMIVRCAVTQWLSTLWWPGTRLAVWIRGLCLVHAVARPYAFTYSAAKCVMKALEKYTLLDFTFSMHLIFLFFDFYLRASCTTIVRRSCEPKPDNCSAGVTGVRVLTALAMLKGPRSSGQVATRSAVFRHQGILHCQRFQLATNLFAVSAILETKRARHVVR